MTAARKFKEPYVAGFFIIFVTCIVCMTVIMFADASLQLCNIPAALSRSYLYPYSEHGGF